jgi:hypothetical protein
MEYIAICITAGRTLDEAKTMAAEALYGHIEEMRAAGEAVPDPSSLDEVISDPEFGDALAFMVIEAREAVTSQG